MFAHYIADHCMHTLCQSTACLLMIVSLSLLRNSHRPLWCNSLMILCSNAQMPITSLSEGDDS